VSIADVYIDGPNVRRQVVSVETSTPKARLFIEALLASSALAATDYSLTSRELRAIVDRSDLAELTSPMSEPFPDVIQDLWQLSHLTTSYLARALAGGILLATGIVNDNAVAIVVAALFLPFLAEVLAVTIERGRDCVANLGDELINICRTGTSVSREKSFQLLPRCLFLRWFSSVDSTLAWQFIEHGLICSP